VTILNRESTSLTLHWTDLRSKINRDAEFYIILVKNTQGLLLYTETISGGTSTATIEELRPSTQYRVGVYGVDDDGQAYKSVENLTSTANGMVNVCSYISILKCNLLSSWVETILRHP